MQSLAGNNRAHTNKPDICGLQDAKIVSSFCMPAKIQKSSMPIGSIRQLGFDSVRLNKKYNYLLI
jgi:hypothetical protein